LINNNPDFQNEQCVVCCDYQAPFNQWITQLKYGNAHGLARFLGTWLALETQRSNFDIPDILIPVPSSSEKLKRRGYNQAALIARYAGCYLHRPVRTNWLTKIREANTQADLSRTERLNNLQNAFRATRLIPANLKIGLVDDVITTGATLQCCMAALRKAGAQSIVLMAICRTPE
jgi:ComF family protein